MAGGLTARGRQLLRSTLRRRARLLSLDELARPALVFAPHPDDETLGCGGTIVQKRLLRAPVCVVWMTDGSHSHRHLMDAADLRHLRMTEAMAAGRELGLHGGDLLFLGFEDSRLAEHADEAIQRVAEILHDRRPEQVFVPYARETPRDHAATCTIVRQALVRRGLTADIFEYPVWYWHQWPWVTAHDATGDGGPRPSVARGLCAALRLLSDFRCAADVAEFLDVKRSALACHSSQMTQLVDDPGWLTLPGMAGGAWLDCLLQDREYFKRSATP